MAWANKEQYAKLLSSEAGRRLMERLPEIKQSELAGILEKLAKPGEGKPKEIEEVGPSETEAAIRALRAKAEEIGDGVDKI